MACRIGTHCLLPRKCKIVEDSVICTRVKVFDCTIAIPVYCLIGSCWAQVLALFFVVFWEENYGRTNDKD